MLIIVFIFFDVQNILVNLSSSIVSSHTSIHSLKLHIQLFISNTFESLNFCIHNIFFNISGSIYSHLFDLKNDDFHLFLVFNKSIK
ncbi:MAG: hypothetical protein Q8S84_09030 [bacterium]|nr:hypothetical protein [bacterium]MDP3381566.1 hypothetical protein [bacterium]